MTMTTTAAIIGQGITTTIHEEDEGHITITSSFLSSPAQSAGEEEPLGKGWRTVNPSRMQGENSIDDNGSNSDATSRPPNEFICPLTEQVMDDPYMIPSGLNFERTAILDWLFDMNTGNVQTSNASPDTGRNNAITSTMSNCTCPVTGDALFPSMLVPNIALQLRIQLWKDTSRRRELQEESDIQLAQWILPPGVCNKSTGDEVSRGNSAVSPDSVESSLSMKSSSCSSCASIVLLHSDLHHCRSGLSLDLSTRSSHSLGDSMVDFLIPPQLQKSEGAKSA